MSCTATWATVLSESNNAKVSMLYRGANLQFPIFNFQIVLHPTVFTHLAYGDGDGLLLGEHL